MHASTPALWGFPFFYWYQFAWVIVASALLGIVYRKTEDLVLSRMAGRVMTMLPCRLGEKMQRVGSIPGALH